MKNSKSLIPLLFLICFAIIEVFAIHYLFTKYKENQNLERKQYLQENLDKSIQTLEKEFDKISILIAGLKSHVSASANELSSDEVRSYIINQLNFFTASENIIINYIDTNHKFVYSTGTQKKEVNNLAGTSVVEIRSKEVIKKLDELLKTEEIITYPPLNLYEGHVGIPIDFRYTHNNVVKGYFAIIIDIKNLINPILDSDIKKEFVYRYTAGVEEIEFDREKVYDGSKIYNKKEDSENYKRNKKDYFYQTTTFLNLPISIGINYKTKNQTSDIGNFVQSILATLIILLIGSSLLLYFYYQNVQKTKEQNHINKALIRSNKLLKKFIYASSHDIRQPLVNISNFHRLLASKLSKSIDESTNTYLSIVRENIDHSLALLDDLLIYSGIIKEEKNKKLLAVNDILNTIYQAYDKNKIKISYDNILPCYGTKSEIYRLFQNLISNSIKYNENTVVEIKISSHQTDNSIVYSVSDNGIGISKEHATIVFSEFQRVHKNKYKGTGLGLSICKEIVANHGGTIHVKEKPTKGTNIIFSIAKHV